MGARDVHTATDDCDHELSIFAADFVHAPSKVAVMIQHDSNGLNGPSASVTLGIPEARKIFQDGLLLCNELEQEYLRSLPGTLVAAIDSNVTREQIEYGLRRTGFKLVDECLELRTKDGKVWGSVPWPAVHTCAIPPDWTTITVGCPAEVVYVGPMPTAQQVWDACEDQPYSPEVTAGLRFLDELPRVERDAFLGLFAGAKWTWTVWIEQGRPFTMRKSECQAVEDWRGFYLEKLPAAGLLTFTQTEPYETASGPAYKVDVRPTQLGWDVREAFYERRLR